MDKVKIFLFYLSFWLCLFSCSSLSGICTGAWNDLLFVIVSPVTLCSITPWEIYMEMTRCPSVHSLVLTVSACFKNLSQLSVFKIQETSYKIQDAWLLWLSWVCISPTATFGLELSSKQMLPVKEAKAQELCSLPVPHSLVCNEAGHLISG